MADALLCTLVFVFTAGLGVPGSRQFLSFLFCKLCLAVLGLSCVIGSSWHRRHLPSLGSRVLKKKNETDEGREGGQLVQVRPVLTMADGNFAQIHGWNYSRLFLECEQSWIMTITQSHQMGSNHFPIPI